MGMCRCPSRMHRTASVAEDKADNGRARPMGEPSLAKGIRECDCASDGKDREEKQAPTAKPQLGVHRCAQGSRSLGGIDVGLRCRLGHAVDDRLGRCVNKPKSERDLLSHHGLLLSHANRALKRR